MKSLMPVLVVAMSSLLSISSYAAEVTVSPDDLYAGCSMYDNKLGVSKEIRSYDESTNTQKQRSENIYRSSSYFTASGCGQDGVRLEALINLAQISGKKIAIGSSNDINKDFRIVNADGTTISKLAPAQLQVVCRDMHLDGLDRRLVVKVNETVIYATTSYGGLGSKKCHEDRANLETKINAAKVSGKFLKYQFGDSPNNDFNIAD